MLEKILLADAIITAIIVGQVVLSHRYVARIHRLKKEDKLQLLPMYAQELYNSSQRSLALAGENPSFENTSYKDRIKATLHYQFAEFPTFTALYKFFTLDNPEGRDLF